MPRFNELAQVCAGVAGNPSIDGTPIPVPAGINVTRWLNNQDLICASRATLILIHGINGGQSTIVPDKGANFLAAGGGVFNAWVGGLGFYSNTPYKIADSGVGDVGFDGYALIKETYADSLPGRRVLIISPAGAIANGFNTNGTYAWCIRNLNEFCWLDADGHWYNPMLMDTHGANRDLRLHNRWIIYGAPEGLYIHRVNEKNRGYIVGQQDVGFTYNPDIYVEHNVLFWTYSTNPAETPESVKIGSIDAQFTPMVELPPKPQGQPLARPIVTITKDNNWPGMAPDGCKNGQLLEATDDGNKPLGYKFRVLIRDGGLYCEIENNAGMNTTGRFRPVKLG